MIAQELEGYDVEQTLQTIHSLRHTDGFRISWNAGVALIAEDDGLGFAGGNLGEGGLNLGV